MIFILYFKLKELHSDDSIKKIKGQNEKTPLQDFSLQRTGVYILMGLLKTEFFSFYIRRVAAQLRSRKTIFFFLLSIANYSLNVSRNTSAKWQIAIAQFKHTRICSICHSSSEIASVPLLSPGQAANLLAI